MKRNHFLQVIILLFSILISFGAIATQPKKEDPKTWVNAKGRLLIDTFSEKDLAKKYEKLDELFINYVDLDYIAQFVVGKYWRTMDQEQKDVYIPLFKRYALSVYKSFPLNFENKLSFDITSVLPSEKYTDVTTSIDIGGSGENNQPQIFIVIFRLVDTDDGYKIIDIKLAESSLILSYRNRFYEMIAGNDGDIGWFLEDLENVTISTEKTNQMKLNDQ